MWDRPAVQKGANVPDPYKMKELLGDKEKMEKHAAQSREWVQVCPLDSSIPGQH